MYIRLVSLFLFFLFINSLLFSESIISYIEGHVMVLRGNEELAGDFGFTLLKNDTIKTGTGSLAILELEDRGTVKLREDTTLLLKDLGERLTVSLKTGGIFSRIKRILGLEYEVTTQNVVAGVRGTEFFIAYGKKVEDSQDLWLCVNEGTVEVSVPASADSVLVTEGEGITIPAGNRLTQPQYYKWTENLNWNVDPLLGGLADTTDLNAAYADLRDIDYD